MIILISILALVALGIIVMIGTKLFAGKDDEPIVVPASDCSSCDGTNLKCEQVCQMEAATKPIEYYDDEELDRFRGRPSDCFTDEEAELFREILYSMPPGEAKGWNRSLILRGINVPDQIKDELLLMIDGDT